MSKAVSATQARRKSSPLATVGMTLFAAGLLGVIVIMVLFATGSHDLPLWLNLLALLAPVGFGLGLLGVYAEARSARSARPAPKRGNGRPVVDGGPG